MKEWVDSIEKAEKINSETRRKRNKKIIIFIAAVVILFTLIEITINYWLVQFLQYSENVVTFFFLIASLIFFIIITHAEGNKISIGQYYKTVYLIHKLSVNIGSYNKENVILEKDKIKKIISKNLLEIDGRINVLKNRAKNEIYPDLIESDIKTLKKLIYRINYAVVRDEKISEELLELIEKFCEEQLKQLKEMKACGIILNEELIANLDKLITGENEKLIGSETILEKINQKLTIRTKCVILSFISLIIIWFFVDVIMGKIYLIDDNTKVLAIIPFWSVVVFIIYKRNFS
jgi:hypothetical protein